MKIKGCGPRPLGRLEAFTLRTIRKDSEKVGNGQEAEPQRRGNGAKPRRIFNISKCKKI